jgi:hypothetical protein
MHILASGPELQAVRFWYVILGKNGKNVKKGPILKSGPFPLKSIKNKFLLTMTAYKGEDVM